MGGKGSGRRPSTNTLKELYTSENKQEIGTGMFIPNHSGISSHPEAKEAFGLWAKNGNNIYNTNYPNAAQIWYDSSNYGSLTCDSTGDLTLTSSGDLIRLNKKTYIAGGILINAATSIDGDGGSVKFADDIDAGANDITTTGKITAGGVDTEGFYLGNSRCMWTNGTVLYLDAPTSYIFPQTSIISNNVIGGSTIYSTSTANAIQIAGGTISTSSTQDIILSAGGDIDANTNVIKNVVDPSNDQDAATKKYVDDNAGSSPLTTKGDLFTYTTTDARLPVGTNGQHLVADSSESAGIKWSSFQNPNVTSATFDTTADTTLVAAAGAGIKIKVVAISMHNNDSTGSNDEEVHLLDGSGGSDLYGGSNGAIYLPGRGGFFGLPMSADAPWFETTANTALYLDLTNGKRVSGTVWYITEA